VAPLTLTKFGSYTFEHDGVAIHYPVADSSGRFPCTPEAYGFTVWGTGGGCTAWRREFELDGLPAYMLITDNDLSHEVKAGDTLVMGVYLNDDELNANGANCVALWEQNEGALEDTWPRLFPQAASF
jgi:hypothetical protein